MRVCVCCVVPLYAVAVGGAAACNMLYVESYLNSLLEQRQLPAVLALYSAILVFCCVLRPLRFPPIAPQPSATTRTEVQAYAG